jgi:hypothetical protein
MDKKIHKITKLMKKASADIAKGQSTKARKVLKGAAKKNEALKVEDRDVRDPYIAKCEKAGVK